MNDAFPWLDSADSSFRSCVRLLETEELDNAAYLASQAGEKTLKALLVHLGISFRKTHDMAWLASKLPSGHPLQGRAKSISHLTAWSVDHRYPADSGVSVAEPDAATIKGVLQTIETLQASIVALLPKPTSTLVRGLLAIRPLGPGRRNEASITVEASTLRESLANRGAASAKVEAIKALLPSGHQRGYRWEGQRLVKTGETHVEEWAARELLHQLTSGPQPISSGLLTVDALQADAIANRRPDLSKAFDDLVATTAATLRTSVQQASVKSIPGRDVP